MVATYTPLPWQIEPWRDKSPVLLLTGSAGGGKSVVAAQKVHGFCLKYPGAMGLALRKARQHMVNSTVLVLERNVMAKQGITHVPSKYRFEYPNGSILAYGGMSDEDQREAIRSIGQSGGLDIAWMEEASAFTEPDFNELLARMRGRAADWRQLLLTTNPDAPQHWIYRRLIEGGEAKVYKSRAADNAHLPDDYAASLARMTGVQRQRLADGQWVQAEGLIYPEYDATIHRIGSSEVPEIQRYFAAQDWGYSHPAVFQVWGLDADGRMYRLREVYKSHELIGWWVEQARSLARQYRLEAIVCDPAEPGFIAEYRNAGLPAIAAVNDVHPGIQAVAQRLQVQLDGFARMYFVREPDRVLDPVLVASNKPTCTEDEITGYVRAKSREGSAVKEDPVKVNDDGCDTTRYASMYANGIGRVTYATNTPSFMPIALGGRTR